MCEPVTLTAVAAGGALLGAGVSVYGQISSGQSQQKVAENNARLTEYRAADATQQGAYDAAHIMSEGRGAVATGQAIAGAGGIDSTTGSTADLFTTSMINAGVDAARAKANAARAAWGYGNEAEDLRTQGRINKRTSILGAIGTGLSGIGSAAGSAAGGFGKSGK